MWSYILAGFIGWIVGTITIPVGMAVYIGLDWRKQDKEYEQGPLHKGPLL